MNKPLGRLRYYTVIGIYLDNHQVWMEHVLERKPVDAARSALAKVSENGSGDPVVADVIAGKHQGLLHNTSLVRNNDGVLNEIGER